MVFLNILVFTTLLNIASADSDCDACLDGVCYSKTPILDGYRFSGQLAVDRTENIVYFHYEDAHSNDYTAAFDLDDVRFQAIPGIDFSFARTVDQSNRDVYIGGASGIFKYNPITNITTEYGLFDKTIWHMQFNDKIYYTIFQTKGLFTIEKKQTKNPTKNLAILQNYTIDDFIIDNRDDIYFLSQSKVYRLKKGANEVTVFANDVYSLTTDKNDRAHFVHTAKRGLYNLDLNSDNLIEVGAFGSGIPLKSVFDNNNNIIYHENGSRKLFYLMPNYGKCRVSTRPQIKPKNKKLGFIGPEENLENAFLVIKRLS